MTLRKRFQIFRPKAADNGRLLGVVSDFQRFSIHDGPGIRTIVFLKGCPLRCQWCQNPESMQARPEILYIRNNCIGCNQCLEACPTHCIEAVSGRGIVIDKAACLLPLCGACQAVCYANAINICGRYLGVDEVLEEVELDREFYERSGGGVTFSGGEPFAQPRFLLALAAGAKARGLHTAIETCGQADWEVMEPVLAHLDTVLYDLKHMDPEIHRRLTGVDNRRILDNLRRIDRLGLPIRVRLPLVPGRNDSPENLRATAAFVAELTHVEALDVLPYHRMGEPKWGQLDKDYPLHGLAPYTKDAVFALAAIMEAYPIRVTVGG
ncbi:MAG: glycyl-radical enzyme activating protein [Solidesulfovibrio sp.]|uniref:glycyl-radical enzyme activating protein n=1 Tax=Solidesulfovibrio sp. TaxID=2910990 RepID=UPI003157FDC1